MAVDVGDMNAIELQLKKGTINFLLTNSIFWPLQKSFKDIRFQAQSLLMAPLLYLTQVKITS